jgi:hypothetical protein
MKTRNLDLDQLAKFVARKCLKVQRYNFDLFYDIKKIVDLKNNDLHGSEIPSITELHLFLRPFGSWLTSPDTENYQMYFDSNEQVYKLVFCWNCNYFINQSFCKITRLK